MRFLAMGVLTVATGLGAWAGEKNPAQIQPGSQAVQLQLQLGDGRTAFHRGEVIPVQLQFSSAKHAKYPTNGRDCFPHSTYRYQVDPPAFIDRVLEVDAGMSLAEMTCGGPMGGEIDLAETPVLIKQTLNERFRMDTPGKYHISVTAWKFGVSAISDTVDLEILPSDPAWEKAELSRATSLIDSGSDKQSEGCLILRYLGTDAANLEMARRYSGRGACAQVFDLPIISAPNRKDVLEVLESGLRDPDKPITAMYLRVLAFVSLYQQHPEWYPQPPTPAEQNNPEFVHSQRAGLWSQREAIQSEELRYMKLLAAALPQKDPEARAISMLTFVNRGGALPPFGLPEEIQKIVRDQLPGVLIKLSDFDRQYALQKAWPEFRSPAMVPVLKQIIGSPYDPAMGLALRRLYELSPEDARPIILNELRNPFPRLRADVLGLLPERELPELDTIMLERVKTTSTGMSRITATGLLQRYASSAISHSVRPLLEAQLGNPDCETEANLFAYFLRVDPSYGARLLHQEMQTPDRPGCLLLRRLATVRMSPEVEEEALAKLNDTNSAVVSEALFVLREFASAKSKQPLLDHFRAWHAQWEPKAKELQSAQATGQPDIDVAFVDALGAAQGWFTSNEEWRSFQPLCLTDRCRQRIESQLVWGTVNYRGHVSYMIGISEPVGPDDVAEHFSVANCGRLGDLERLKAKLAQYPNGSFFLLDARDKNPAHVQRIYADLHPWAERHGFNLDIYRE